MKKLIATVAGAGVAIFLIANFIASLYGPQHAVDFAMAECQDSGWEASQLRLKSSQLFGGPLGKTAIVIVTADDGDRPHTIEVALHKTIPILPWRLGGSRDYPSDSPRWAAEPRLSP